ncbi:hypothetical protein V6N12_062113 [Hibiscus sabdariffa]|uniref:Putative plant transposon protein domain-containing protein n=1 Tax=Hibiscus sabdariffa TaxID=183260 RepID=A0ABR2F819_9ROSI
MANTSSSSAEGMPHQHRNPEFRARYTMVAAKNRWEEQGFYLDDNQVNYGLEPIIYSRLHELGWFRLARQPARANLNWVMEFYTNNAAGEDNADGEDNATVRGRIVTANATIINSILDLPNDNPSLYAMLGALEDEDYEQIKNFLYEEGTTWNTTGRNPHSVSCPSLRPEARLWNTFVKRNLMPTSHNQTVDRTRLELAAACKNDKGILAFPCLIKALCRRWTRSVYMRKMDVADVAPINVAMPTAPTSPIHTTATDPDEAGPSAPAEAQPTPPASPPVFPVPSHTSTTSQTTTPAVMPPSR